MPVSTPQNSSKRKDIGKMNKAELIEEVNFHRHNEVALKFASSSYRNKYVNKR